MTAGWSRRVAAAAVLTAATALTSSAANDGTPVPRAAPPPLTAAQPPLTAAQLRADAAAAETGGRWDAALDAYLKLHALSPSPEFRERIRSCLRNATQARRFRDPAFQQFVLNLTPADALGVYADAVGKLSGLYADRDRAAPAKLFAQGLDELDRALGDPAFRQRHLPAADPAKVQAFRERVRATGRGRLPATVREARQAARDLAFAARDHAAVTNPAAVILELICGACAGLDEYTVYLAPTGSQSDLAGPIAEFAGYGILIAFQGSDVVVDGLVPGSWAASHTGLRKGDRLARVNGRSVQPGTPAALADAVRDGITAHELELAPPDGMIAPTVRLPVPVPTVYAAEMVQLKDGVGYARLAAFRDATPLELAAAVYDLKARGMRALVLDLRGNPGGAFPAAVLVAQRFLPAGIVATTQGQSPEFDGRVFSSDAGMTAWDFPVVLLVDAKTMSAAEVVAVALKDHNRATLVGLPTFGKGAVQAPVRLSAADGTDGKGGVLVLTVATVTGPRGVPLNGGGVVPHVLEPDPVRQLDQAVGKAAELVGGR